VTKQHYILLLLALLASSVCVSQTTVIY